MDIEFKSLAIPDVVLVIPNVYRDARGFFSETYKESVFARHGIRQGFCQMNHSRSVKGVLRGMHYQLPPHAQAKLVQVITGEIVDVAVDIRRGSPYYGRWVSAVLSDANKHMMYIPEGFAHGFCTLSETADVIYYCSSEYAPTHDRGIMYNDPDVGIEWPVDSPSVSSKDSGLPVLKEAENCFEYP